MILLPTGQATGDGSTFQKEVTTAVAPGAANAFLPTVGVYYAIVVGADIVTEVVDSAGTWRTVAAAGVLPGAGAPFETDGNSYRFRNGAAAGNENVTLIRLH